MKEFTIHIEVHGPTQILPNATTAVQNFYGDEYAKQMADSSALSDAPLTEDEKRLSIYIHEEEKLRGYVASLRACRTAAEVGEVVATLCDREDRINSALAVKECFISLLLPFLTGLERGKGIDNLRVQINEALAKQRRASRQKRF